jgi:hypothetical protein
MLSQNGPALLIQCKNQIDFGRQLVENWLNSFMFKGKDGGDAKRIAEYLSNHGNFKTHSKHLNIDFARKLGLIIGDIESSQDFQEHVLSAFHATMLTLNTAAVKIICNQNGNAFVKQMPIQIQQIQKPKQP